MAFAKCRGGFFRSNFGFEGGYVEGDVAFIMESGPPGKRKNPRGPILLRTQQQVRSDVRNIFQYRHFKTYSLRLSERAELYPAVPVLVR